MRSRVWPWMVIGVGLVCAWAVAAPPGHDPFARGQAPRSVHLTECEWSKEGDRTEDVSYTFRSPDRKAVLRTRLVDGGTEISLVGADGRSLLARPAVNPMGTCLLYVYTADLNADGKSDYVVQIWSGGCGLGGELCGVTFLLSSGEAYSAVYAETFDFGAEDLLKPERRGSCSFVQSQFASAGEEQTRDGKIHSFWVYRLWRFDGARLVEAKDDKRFPKWVWYTDRENHAATDLLGARHKAELLKGLDVPK